MISYLVLTISANISDIIFQHRTIAETKLLQESCRYRYTCTCTYWTKIIPF